MDHAKSWICFVAHNAFGALAGEKISPISVVESQTSLRVLWLATHRSILFRLVALVILSCSIIGFILFLSSSSTRQIVSKILTFFLLVMCASFQLKPQMIYQQNCVF